ncbi:MAG TPA: peptide-methionine (S)-S-oxide reductase, partial [Paralcaligenes sp.]
MKMDKATSSETAVFGSGCFWCAEPVFKELRGVHDVTPGYSGGHVDNP